MKQVTIKTRQQAMVDTSLNSQQNQHVSVKECAE